MTKFIRIITLSGFVLLIISFVAYKSGAFNANTAANVSLNYPVDSPDVKPSDTALLKKPMMSGSKSMIIMDDLLINSSKSGKIFTPEPDSSKKTEPKN